MYFRFLTARFAIIVASAAIIQFSFADIASADEVGGLPTIEIHLEALDKFAPVSDLQNSLPEQDVRKKFTHKKTQKPIKPIVKEAVKPVAPAKTTEVVKIEKPAPVAEKIEKKPEPNPESQAAQKAVDKAVVSTKIKTPVFKDEAVSEKAPVVQEKTSPAALPVPTPAPVTPASPPVSPVTTPKIEVPSAPALPVPLAAEPVVPSVPKVEVPVVLTPAPTPAPKAEELPQPKLSGMSAADMAEAQKALAPIAEIKPTIPAVPVVPDAPPTPVAAPSAVDLTPLPPPPSPAGEMAAALAPAPVAVPTTPTPAVVVEKTAVPLPVPEVPAKVDATKGNPDLSIKFLSTETAVPLSAQDDLKKLVAKVKANGERITIISYASGSGDKATTARRVSLSRALAVRAFLIEHDVDKLKINVQAEGDKSAGGEPDRVDMFVSK